MVLEEVKAKAITMLKVNVSIVDVAEALNISPAQVQEWNDSVEHNVIEDLEAELVIQERAMQLVTDGIVHEGSIVGNKLDILQDKLHNRALKVLELMTYPVMTDYEQVKALSIASDIVTKMQTAFFKTGPSVAIQNNIGTGDTEQVSKFKGLMKN